MNIMWKSKLVISLSGLVVFSGILVTAGWVFDIEVLKSILPIWVTMKFTTAFSFILSGFVLYFVKTGFEQKSDGIQMALTISILIILLIMVTFLLSSVFNIRTGVEDFFVRELEGAIKTSTPGRPSIGTMFNFLLVSVIGIFTMYEVKKLAAKIHFTGFLILGVGCTAILGYILSVPTMYFLFEGYSSAMAIHTAILFIILGTGFIILGKSNINRLNNF